jgi:GntR family transcriptional repressor for pyruvate dehydrogenase complex
MAVQKAALGDTGGHAKPYAPAAVIRASYADQAYSHLFHQITSGEFAEGDLLPSEHELTAMFGISRPVVRQALKLLRQDDLIESRQGFGSIVKHRYKVPAAEGFSDSRMREILMNLEFRKVIEPQSAYIAAQRRSDADLAAIKLAVDEFKIFAVKVDKVAHHLDFKFHHRVATASGNHRFVEAISAVEYDIDKAVNLARYLARYDHLERARFVWTEHLGIYNAILQQDAELARELMSNHLDQARARMLEVQPAPST